MTETSSTPASDPATPLVDRVRVEMARQRALAEALRPGKPTRRPAVTPGAPLAKRPPRRAN